MEGGLPARIRGRAQCGWCCEATSGPVLVAQLRLVRRRHARGRRWAPSCPECSYSVPVRRQPLACVARPLELARLVLLPVVDPGPSRSSSSGLRSQSLPLCAYRSRLVRLAVPLCRSFPDARVVVPYLCGARPPYPSSVFYGALVTVVSCVALSGHHRFLSLWCPCRLLLPFWPPAPWCSLLWCLASSPPRVICFDLLLHYCPIPLMLG
jgi:hypothetical protein